MKNGQTIGVCDFLEGGYEGENNGYINLLMIGKSFRGIGIGSNILKLIEEKMKMKGSQMVIGFVQTII